MLNERRRILLLDVMGTLVHDPFYEEVPVFFATKLNDLWTQLEPGLWVDFEKDLVDEATFLKRFFADGRDYDHTGFVDCVRDAYRFLDGIEPLLAELKKSAQCEMHLLSNYPSWYHLVEQRTRLSQFAPWSFVSCDTGVRKPDPQAYLGPAEKLGVATKDCLFVDDREKNCAAARAVGMDAIRYTNADQLRAELVGRKLLIQ